MKIIKFFSLILVLCGSALFMPHAHATCTAVNVPYRVAMSEIRVSSTLATGNEIPGTEQTIPISGSCSSGHDGNVIIACYYGTGQEYSNFPGVYHTGVDGVGITLINDQGQRVSGSGSACDTRNTPLGYISSDGKDTFSFSVTLSLVKTSDTVTSGELQQAQTEFGIGVYKKEGLGSPNRISYSGNIDFNQVTCTVTPASIAVTLGDFPLSTFTGTGATTQAKQFDVGINCNDNVQPSIMISSANGYESSYPGVVKLTPEDGAATGIGVQMTMDGQPVTFDEYINTTEQTVENQQIQIPFTARYYQTAPQVTPGTANSVSTLTIAYK